MFDSINQYIIRISIFLFLILLVIVLAYPVLQQAFLSNIYINLIIVFSLLIGLIFCIYHLIKLNSNYSALSNFNIHKSPQIFLSNSKFLKNLHQQLSEINGRFLFKSSRIDKILESTDLNLLSIRETSRYLVGLLIFLGLLGTFWGLLKTIGSVANVIEGLGIDDTNVAGFFNSLKDGLNAPLEGMSIAFSSSLLGLAGSLILGFVDLNLGQAQNKFAQYLEKFLQNNSSPDFINSNTAAPSTLSALQKIYDNLDSLVFTLNETSKNQTQIFTYMKTLSDQIKEINKNYKDQDKKISNFLSTQLNTQSSILQLTTKLGKDGILDNQTKKVFKNIEQGINQLISNSKKNK